MKYIKRIKASNSDLIALFNINLPKVYSKYGDIAVRPATVGEVIETKLKGVVETKSKPAEQGDMVAIGINGEQYLIKANKFLLLYKHVKDNIYRPLGKVKAIVVPKDMYLEFNAPWGETMIANPGDYLATSSSDNYDPSKLYRIEKQVFETTFK